MSRLGSIAFKVLVGLLASLGVVSICVHLVVLALIGMAASIEPGNPEWDGTERERRRAFEPRAPQWFPDGNGIAFSHAGGVYVIDSAGSRLRLIDGGGDDLDLAYGPSVSPDGSRIAYSAYKKSGWFWNKSESWEIVTINPDGSGKRQLTEDDRLDVNPAWSPDGTNVVFQSERWRINTIGADGSDLGFVVNPVEVTWSKIVGPPALSPDESHIAFPTEVQEQGRGMYVVGADGSNLTRLANETGLAAWSPDGSRIAFAKREAWDSNHPSGTAAGVYTIRIDGSDLREVVAFPSREVEWVEIISWSLDGSEILFGSYVIDADGSAMRKLPGPGTHASWSPDGSRIAVYTGRNANIILYTVAPDGSDFQVLVKIAEDGGLKAAR